jgi:polysaccharide export outer membrane protein
MRSSVRRLLTVRTAIAVACLIVTSAACATVQIPFVWVDEWQEPESPPASAYVIGTGDTLKVQVWAQDNLSTTVRVRSDGQVSLVFLGDVPAAGMAPAALGRALEDRFKGFIVSPQVTVSVEEVGHLSVPVLGQVAQPGVHDLEPGAGVAEALAVAGGLRDFAHKDRIYLLRGGASPARIRMTYVNVTAGLGRAGRLKLIAGDVLVVE